MRLLLWTAAIWSVMFLGVVTIDIGYTVSTGTPASSAVTKRIDFTPDESSLLGTMERVSRELDRLGDKAFGRYVGLMELLLYGVLVPLLIAGPLAWEAHRRRWTRSGAIVIGGLCWTCHCTLGSLEVPGSISSVLRSGQRSAALLPGRRVFVLHRVTGLLHYFTVALCNGIWRNCALANEARYSAFRNRNTHRCK